MPSACLLLCSLLTVSLVRQPLPLQRFPAGQAIDVADDRELMRLAGPHGTPWLIFEPDEIQIRGNWHARVYLQPETVGAPVRRGRLLLFSARTPPDHEGAKTWKVDVAAYAQVPAAVAGPLSTTAHDLPFIEWNRLPDADLLALVSFIRSSPSAPERSNPGGPTFRVEGGKPIQSIRRGEGTDVEVVVMRDRSASWILTVRKVEGTWRAIDVRFVIA